MAANEAKGSTRSLVVWWFGCVTAATVVVALGVWLVARPNEGSTTPSAADRSGTNGSVVARSPGAAGSTSTSGPGPRPAGISTPAPPLPAVRGRHAGERLTQQPGETQPPEQPVRLPGVPSAPQVGRHLVSRPVPEKARTHGRPAAGHPRKVVPAPRRVQVRRSSGAAQSTTVSVTLQARTGRHATALLERDPSALTVRAPGALASISRRAERVVVTADGHRAAYSLHDVLPTAPSP